jgi:hypothetical protein
MGGAVTQLPSGPATLSGHLAPSHPDPNYQLSQATAITEPASARLAGIENLPAALMREAFTGRF